MRVKSNRFISNNSRCALCDSASVNQSDLPDAGVFAQTRRPAVHVVRHNECGGAADR